VDSRNHKKVPMTKKKKVLLFVRVLGILAGVLLVIYIGCSIMIKVGERNLYNKATSSAPVLEFDEIDEDTTVVENTTEPVVWEEGWVRYNGEIYEYNSDILTFLVLGIDKSGEAKESKNATDGGQSDAMFLLVINPHNKKMSILAIDRNTMTDITMVGMGDFGQDLIGTAQLAIQHGFGDGKNQSCELTRDAVSALYFDLPIHGYISVNYEAIPIINDAVGGVEVVIPADAAGFRPGWIEGETVLLKGNDSIVYVKKRDTTVFESARMRASRQKNYLTTLMGKIKDATKADVTVPLTIYSKISKYTVTDITADEMSYLATILPEYSFSGDDIYMMPGETVMGEEFEEFYPDMTALKAQMIEIFYEKVEF